MILRKVIHFLNRDTKAIDRTCKYIKCSLHGNVPVHIPLVTVDTIVMSYGHIHLKNKRREHYPDYRHVMPVSMSYLDDALDTITDFLPKKEGGNDE